MSKTNLIYSVIIVVICVIAGNAQGRYANVYSRTQVEGFVRQLEQSSDLFRDDFRREVDNSGLNNSTRRLYLGYLEQFENGIDRLRSRFSSNQSWWESRNEVRSTISASQNLNSTMNNANLRRRLERQWNRLRNDINKLADTYDLPGLAGGGWNGGNSGGWQGGDGGVGQASRPPTWAQGTFYGIAPNGSQIMLTIDRNGRVTADIGGSTSYGSYNRGMLTMGYNTARVNRVNNGIETVSTTNGETITYSRSDVGYGNGGYGNGNPGGINPPSWAIGSFVGRSPIDNAPIYMNVDRDGSVTVRMGGSQSYGSMDGTTLSMGSSTARVQRDGNGFRTVSTTDGQTIYYRRN